MKFGRNDACWCGSGKKYKNCHQDLDRRLMEYEAMGAIVPDRMMIKNQQQLEGIRKSGQINTAALDMVAENIGVGISTEQLDRLVHDFIINHGGIPATLDYNGYPKSICTSINNEICHGIPSKDVFLKDGDIINVDITTIYDGYFADASRMFLIGNVSNDGKRLVEVTKQCLDLGLKAAQPWGFLGDIGEAIETHAKKNGYSVVEEIGGHGVGIEFHEEPYVSHIGEKGKGVLLVPGMVFTIEPMINEGSCEIYQHTNDDWTVYTKDGKLSAQWEYTVAITQNGVEILTH